MVMEKRGVRPSDLPEQPDAEVAKEQPEDVLKTAAEEQQLQRQFEDKPDDKDR